MPSWDNERVFASGMPMNRTDRGSTVTATLITSELHALFNEHPFIHISTFGGVELGRAAPIAMLDVIGEPEFLDTVRGPGTHFARRYWRARCLA